MSGLVNDLGNRSTLLADIDVACSGISHAYAVDIVVFYGSIGVVVDSYVVDAGAAANTKFILHHGTELAVCVDIHSVFAFNRLIREGHGSSY